MLYTAALGKIDITLHWSRQSLAGSSLCCLARLSKSTLLLELLARLERGLGHSGWVLVLSWMASFTLVTFVSSRQGLSSALQEVPGCWLLSIPKYYYHWLRHNLELEGCLGVT